MVRYNYQGSTKEIHAALDKMKGTTENAYHGDTFYDYPDISLEDIIKNASFHNITHLMNFSHIPYDPYDDYFYDMYGCSREEYYNGKCEINCERDYSEDYDKSMYILLPIICSVGIVGIILTVIVLSHKNMSTSTNCYLTSLAITDMCFLLFAGIKFIELLLSREGHYLYMTIGIYVYIFVEIFLLTSVWLTVMLAIERYIAICHPLRAMSICTVQRARFIILGIFLFALACRAPLFFTYQTVTFEDGCLQKKVVYIQRNTLGNNETFQKAYAWVVNCFVCAAIPFSVLLFLNGCLIREIHRSTNYLRYHLAIDSNVQTIITSEEVKITMMLISVIIVFFVCSAPYLIWHAVKGVILHKIFEHYRLLTDITNILLALRSSFNFVLYCWFSEKFWNTFKRTFCVPACKLIRSRSWRASRIMGTTSEHNGHSNNNQGQIPLSSSRITNGHVETVETIKELHSNEV